MSWKLPPEELLDAAYTQSLWAIQKTVLMVLLGCVGGTAGLGGLLFGGLHRGVRNLSGILQLCRCGVRG